MLKLVARNSLLYYLSGILTKGISFFLLPLYTSILSTSDYGVLELMSIVSTLAINVFSLQINQAVARFYNELKGPLFRIYSSTVALFSLASFSGFFLLTWVFRQEAAAYLDLPVSQTVLAFGSIAFNGLFYLSQNQLTWKLMPKQEMISGLIYNITTISFTLYFILVSDLGIEGIFRAQIIGAAAGISTGILFTHRDLGMKFSLRVLKKLFRFSIPLVPGALSIFLYMFMDRICVREILGLEDLGVFSVGNKIASMLTFATAGFSTAFTPILYKHYKNEDTPGKIAFLFRTYSAACFVAMAFLAFFAGWLVKLLATAEYGDAEMIIPFMLFAIYLNSLTAFFPGLNLAQRTFTISLIAIFAGSLNIVFNILLIPKFGIVAAAISTFLAYGINFILLFIFSQKIYPVKVSLRPLAMLTLIYMGMLLVSHYIQPNLVLLCGIYIFTVVCGILLIMKKDDFTFIRKKGMAAFGG